MESFPPELQLAQDSIHLPEVQEMLHRLSKYNLGIFMPHMHTEESDFAVLPHGMTQVERDLQVSFMATEDEQLQDAVEVGWFWREGSVEMCKRRCDAEKSGKHCKSHVGGRL
ncbi:MAG TPA: hypothetical protein VN380_16600 [Thermoanaerobaculia bacterium]|jgi:hypothetical protein|nr:hypothetical protein [Thermoanaerobaculia bacterium]